MPIASQQPINSSADQPRKVKRQALDHLFSEAYEELRRLARAIKQNDGSATLNPTALVNEAWLKLANSQAVDPTSNLHLKHVVARAMRQVLVDMARRRNSSKRGGEFLGNLSLSEGITDRGLAGFEQLLVLDEALNELERIAPPQAVVVESRFFGGLNVAETAELMRTSEATVNRHWSAARAWLKLRFRQARVGSGDEH